MKCLRRYLPWVTIAVFLFMVLLSLTAGWTGFDPDIRWGPFRTAVFLLGAAGLLGAALLAAIRALDRRALSKRHAHPAIAPSDLSRSPSSQAAVPLEAAATSRRKRLERVAVVVAVALIGVTYVGLVSVWHWSEWPAATTSYASLAEAFIQGKTYLDLDLGHVDFNLSYYGGRIYMYWGPVPAAILAALRFLGVPFPGDEVVGFAAISFIFLFSYLTLLRLRRVYFESLPPWLMIAGLITVATIHPMLWFQNTPGLMTAAIASGQAFLVGGVFFMTRALTVPRPAARDYAAPGALWALAIASRATTAPPVIALVLGAGLLSLRRAGPSRPQKSLAVNVASLLAPLVLVLALYGWYNMIRFGSPLETGWRYAPYNTTRFGTPPESEPDLQIAPGDENTRVARGGPVSFRYLIPNTFYHLFAPLRPISTFPYLRAVYYEYKPFNQLLPRLGVPAAYGVEDAAGLVFAAPALFFALMLARKLLYGEVPSHSGNDSPTPKEIGLDPVDQGALGTLLLIAALAGALPVFLVYFSTVRYELDFVPLLAIVAVLGMWRLHEDTRLLPFQGRLATAAIILIMAGGTLASFLLAVSGGGSRLDDLNPDLFLFLVNSLPHW